MNAPSPPRVRPPGGEVGALFRVPNEAQIRLGWTFLWPSFIRGSLLDENRRSFFNT
jgi:hypothetical protein